MPRFESRLIKKKFLFFSNLKDGGYVNKKGQWVCTRGPQFGSQNIDDLFSIFGGIVPNAKIGLN